MSPKYLLSSQFIFSNPCDLQTTEQLTAKPEICKIIKDCLLERKLRNKHSDKGPETTLDIL